ncbi:hypothetical protein BpHYR1_016428 [Brachionus plicatilis]|uniref:Uncharacterized protein n=1 Tax=Brachionus plicatilis TaxID=10195 RepID=A0A3M7RPM2_BRAPC|nr:hypothetical protein BpHYR1_016428 [Brachionus plicatilis]
MHTVCCLLFWGVLCKVDPVSIKIYSLVLNIISVINFQKQTTYQCHVKKPQFWGEKEIIPIYIDVMEYTLKTSIELIEFVIKCTNLDLVDSVKYVLTHIKMEILHNGKRILFLINPNILLKKIKYRRDYKNITLAKTLNLIKNGEQFKPKKDKHETNLRILRLVTFLEAIDFTLIYLTLKQYKFIKNESFGFKS